MVISFEAAVTKELEDYAAFVDLEDIGAVDENGTRWAMIPLSGPTSIFSIARSVVRVEELEERIARLKRERDQL